MTEHDDLWNKVKQAIQTDHDEFTIEPIREFLSNDENRRGYRGSTGKGGIGDYYCIPVDVLHKCGMSIDEIFYGKAYVEKQEFNRKHMCIKCGEIAKSLDDDEKCIDCCRAKTRISTAHQNIDADYEDPYA